MKRRKYTYTLGTLAAAALVALTAPLATAAPHYLGVNGKKFYPTAGCHNLSDFANGNTDPEVPLLNETGAPVYVHWNKDCKQPPQRLLSGDELNGVTPNSASIYIPPLS
jgi:hypothetical protein